MYLDFFLYSFILSSFMIDIFINFLFFQHYIHLLFIVLITMKNDNEIYRYTYFIVTNIRKLYYLWIS